MYPDLCTVLGHSAANPPTQTLFTIEDILPASGAFLIPHFASLFLKAPSCNTLLLASASTATHYRTVAAKLGVILEPRVASTKRFFCLETRDVLPEECPNETGSICDRLFDAICAQLDLFTDADAPTCLIIDSLGFLLDLGVTVHHVLLFVRECRRKIFARNGIVCICVENDSSGAIPSEFDLLVNAVGHLADCRLVVTPFGAGFSKDVTGKLEIFTYSPQSVPQLTPSSTTLHYRLGERSVKFMAPGLSDPVL